MSDLREAVADRLDRAADRMCNSGSFDEEHRYRSAAAAIRAGLSLEETQKLERRLLIDPQPGMMYRLSALAAPGEYDNPTGTSSQQTVLPDTVSLNSPTLPPGGQTGLQCLGMETVCQSMQSGSQSPGSDLTYYTGVQGLNAFGTGSSPFNVNGGNSAYFPSGQSVTLYNSKASAAPGANADSGQSPSFQFPGGPELNSVFTPAEPFNATRDPNAGPGTQTQAPPATFKWNISSGAGQSPQPAQPASGQSVRNPSVLQNSNTSSAKFDYSYPPPDQQPTLQGPIALPDDPIVIEDGNVSIVMSQSSFNEAAQWAHFGQGQNQRDVTLKEGSQAFSLQQAPQDPDNSLEAQAAGRANLAAYHAYYDLATLQASPEFQEIFGTPQVNGSINSQGSMVSGPANAGSNVITERGLPTLNFTATTPSFGNGSGLGETTLNYGSNPLVASPGLFDLLPEREAGDKATAITENGVMVTSGINSPFPEAAVSLWNYFNANSLPLLPNGLDNLMGAPGTFASTHAELKAFFLGSSFVSVNFDPCLGCLTGISALAVQRQTTLTLRAPGGAYFFLGSGGTIVPTAPVNDNAVPYSLTEDPLPANDNMIPFD
jgi:hypothetical protein